MGKLESSMDRKQILNILFDMIKSGKISGARVLHIIMNNLEHETAEDVLQTAFGFTSTIMGKYLHAEAYDQRNSEAFDVILRIMQSGRFNAFPSTMELLLKNAIGYSNGEQAERLVYKWYVTGKVTSADD